MNDLHPEQPNSSLAIALPRPSRNYVWCDECYRWEGKGGRFVHPKPDGIARFWYRIAALAIWLARPLLWLNNQASYRGNYYLVLQNKKNGVMIVGEDR